jgi:hypothetical protein
MGSLYLVIKASLAPKHGFVRSEETGRHEDQELLEANRRRGPTYSRLLRSLFELRVFRHILISK